MGCTVPSGLAPVAPVGCAGLIRPNPPQRGDIPPEGTTEEEVWPWRGANPPVAQPAHVLSVPSADSHLERVLSPDGAYRTEESAGREPWVRAHTRPPRNDRTTELP